MNEMEPFTKRKINHCTKTCLCEKDWKYFSIVFKASYEAKLLCEPMCVLGDLLNNPLYIYCNLKFSHIHTYKSEIY